MFQNMGPAPGARSGHAMASYADKVLVLGGEAIDGTPDNPTLIHVLDTGASNLCESERPQAYTRLTRVDLLLRARCHPQPRSSTPRIRPGHPAKTPSTASPPPQCSTRTNSK
jgi:hypothetical protein